MPDPAALVTLRNGGTVPAAAVAATMIALERLRATCGPVALYELERACRDRGHPMFGRTGSQAMSLALVESLHLDGTVEISGGVRDIVLSAVAGEGLNVVLVSPLAGEQ